MNQKPPPSQSRESYIETEPELVFHIENLDCADCAATLEQAIANLPSVSEAHVDFMRARLRVVPVAGDGVGTAIASRAQALGHVLVPEDDGGSGPAARASRPPAGFRNFAVRHRKDLATAATGLFIVLAFAAGRLGAPEEVVRLLLLVGIISSGFYIARAAWTSLRATRSLDMNTLMSLAILGAVAIGEWFEGAMVVFLFSIGEALEGHTMDRARNAISTLIDLSPREAILVRDGHEDRVPVQTLRVGDLIRVPPGERIGMDGTIEGGQSAVNQAPVTGESMPVDKIPGDTVFAGSVNGLGALTVRVTRLAADNTIARIIRMVEDAQSQRAPAQRFVDAFARYYTPAIVLVALIVTTLPPALGMGTWNEWLYRGLVLLVIGCPCALVISTPVSIVSAIASAARSGVVVKGGTYIEALGKIKVIAFDKTGTLTRGEPQVVDSRCVLHTEPATTEDCASCRRMLTIAAAVESRSEHPLAQAVVKEAERQGLEWQAESIQDVEAVSGRGIHGVVNGHAVTLGSHSFIHENVESPSHNELFCREVETAEANGNTVMVVDCSQCGVQGYIAVADTVRENAPEAVRKLKAAGIARTVMLTGDNAITAGVISRLSGVDEFRASLLPEDKVAAVQELLAHYGQVAMVGDGINDAPALAQATVGIAMGAAGSATALETADVALMNDDLLRIPFAVQLGRLALRTIKQNIVFALALKAIFLALAVAGVATLWMAVFADVGASLIVILNGMRLLGVRPKV